MVVGRDAHGNPQFAGGVGVEHVVVHRGRSQEGEVLVLGDDDACRAAVVALVGGGHLDGVVALGQLQVVDGPVLKACRRAAGTAARGVTDRLEDAVVASGTRDDDVVVDGDINFLAGGVEDLDAGDFGVMLL